MQIKKIINLIDQSNVKLVILLCHHNADPDSIGSAFALKGLLKRLKPNLKIQIGAPGGPSKLSSIIMDHLQIEIDENPNFEKVGLFILLDTNTIQQLNSWRKKIKTDVPLVMIDHHTPHQETENISTLSIVDEKASSTCVIIYRLFKEINIEPSKAEAKALFLGIAFDTRHFILATSETLKIIADLSNEKFDSQKLLSLLSIPMDFSERIARLKAANRVKIVRINYWLIAIAHISAYQASSARGLVALGADVAVVAGKKNDEIQVSFRASKNFFLSTNIHMGRDLAMPLGEFIGGMGGGHSLSAGSNGKGELNKSLDYVEKLLRIKLS